MRSHHILPKLMMLGVGSGLAAFLFGKRQPGTSGAIADTNAQRVDVDSRLDADASVHDAFDAADLDAEPTAIPDGYDIDPADPVQGIDEINQLHLESLGVDAMSMVDADADVELAEVESSLDEASMQMEPAGVRTLDDVEQSARDTGDLYGVHTPRAEDRTHRDDDPAMNDGQNWLEALETDAAENGPVAEIGVEGVVDDEDVYGAPHASDNRDTPVADLGSGGPGGI